MSLAAPATIEIPERQKRVMPTPVLFGLVAHPIVFVGVLLVSWQLAVSELGRDPIPYQNDPQFLSASIGRLNTLWMILLIAAVPAVIMSVASATGRWSSDRRWLSFAPLAVWVGALLTIAASWDAFVWFID